jgi:hypothetical protein
VKESTMVQSALSRAFSFNLDIFHEWIYLDIVSLVRWDISSSNDSGTKEHQGMKYRVYNGVRLVAAGVIALVVFNAQAETVYYALENVLLEDNAKMTGIFSWTYEVGNFENGEGEFISLDIPSHDENDLGVTFDIGSSIEITLTNNVDSDGLDISLVLEQSLTPTTSSLLTLGVGASKYDIGGDGSYKGLFISGSIVPTNSTLGISTTTSNFVSLSWQPAFPGSVLQETSNFASNWVGVASGGTNFVVVPASVPAKFYRLVTP